MKLISLSIAARKARKLQKLTARQLKTGATESDDEGIVEFEAEYTSKGMHDIHHEIGGFKKINGEWLYSEGMMRPTTVVREGRKIGRNEPCPCGSGKKYKNCCGKN